MKIPIVHVCRCIPEVKGSLPLPLVLFIEHYTNGNTDGSCPSVYYKGEGNYSPPSGTGHGTSHQWKYRRFMSVGVFQKRRELFPPDSIHYA